MVEYIKNGLRLSDLKLNMFLKKLSILLEIKTCEQIYTEYNEIIQSCMDIFALDLLILCMETNLWLIILACFCLIIKKKNIFLKMIEVPNIYLNLSNKTQFRLNKMNKIWQNKLEKERRWVKD